MQPTIRYLECDKINTNNNCKNYEPTFFVSLSQKIREFRKVKDELVKSRFNILDL